MIVVTERVRLPLKISRGTDKERMKLAENLLSNFVNRIEPEFNKRKELSLDRVQAVLRESLPYKRVYVETLQSQNGNGNNFLLHCDDYGRLDALALELETNERGKIGLEQRNSLYHEAYHFFDAICRPKNSSRSMSMDDKVMNDYLNFYHKNFYTKRKIKNKLLSDRLSQFLAKYEDSEKVNLLQQLRYDMIGELGAYSNAEKYVPENGQFHGFNFPEKIKLVSEKLKDQFMSMRTEREENLFF